MTPPAVCYGMNFLLSYTTELCVLCSRPFIPDPTTMDGLCSSCQQELLSVCSPIFVELGESEIPVLAATAYEGPIVQLLEVIKRRGHRRPLRFIAQSLLPVVLEQTSGPLYPVPASRRGRRDRGFDQMQLIAHHTGRSYYSVFARYRGQQQKQLDRESRRRNARETLDLRNRNGVPFTQGVIIDDVVTTGATINRAISLMQDAGAVPGAVVVIAAAL